MRYTLVKLDTTDSTNEYLRHYTPAAGEEMTVAVSRYQTAGRGQGGNKWESEAGKNLLFSVLTHPFSVPARRQFVLSMAAALALRDVLAAMVSGITLKWPNDVYWNDRKISGTLIETRLSGERIAECITGTGVNVNQRVFRSDAPNPVSIANITGKETDIDRLLAAIMEAFCTYYDKAYGGEYAYISRRYHEALYRRRGIYEYADAQGTFAAETVGVDDNGRLLLRHADDGKVKAYGFKEVRFVL